MPLTAILAQKKEITFDDLLVGFCSKQSWDGDIPRWCGDQQEQLTLEGLFRFCFNGSVFERRFRLSFNI